MNLLVVNGPNLNLLGTREPEIYGSKTLKEIESDISNEFGSIHIEWFQSNDEGEIINKIQTLVDGKVNGLILNPAALSHTSIGILDSLKAISIPKVEVHISNTNHREEFRKNKITAMGCDYIMEGFGPSIYRLAISNLKFVIENKG
ncbi:3-dehydroquinate dehydratase [Bacteriovoracaceae bacterium]|nr:3-dehydroquinate dehydratase [Bacteriovoracaceae bacterium]